MSFRVSAQSEDPRNRLIRMLPIDSLTSTSIIDSVLFDRWVRKQKIDTTIFRHRYDSLQRLYLEQKKFSRPLYGHPIVPIVSFKGVYDRYNIDIESFTSEEHSEEFYDSLESKADRNIVTRNLYSWVIQRPNESVKKMKVKSTDYFLRFADKEIGSIKLQQLDIFGPSISDTTIVTTSWVGRAGNATHVNTSKRVILKNLFFKTGSKINPNLLAENERHIRNLSFVKDVNIIIVPRLIDPNIVDVVVVTQDRFSYSVDFSFKPTSRVKFGLKNNNMLGLGHEIRTKYFYDSDFEPNHGVEIGYAINNAWGLFWDLDLDWNNTYKKRSIAANFSKDYISNEAQGAGGVLVDYTYELNYLEDDLRIDLDSMVSFVEFDGWYGRSIPLIQSNIQTDNLVIGGRAHYLKYYDRPVVTQDTNQYFWNRNFYLGSIAFSRQNLYRNNKVYGYGITEDIPYGFYMEWLYGFEHNDFSNRIYSHFYLSKGKILPFGGYFFWSLAGGGYFNSREFEQGVFEVRSQYFSRTFFIGNKDVRQFINVNYINGINRFNRELLYFNSENDIRGFSPEEVNGTQKISVQTESVFYHRRSLYDFQFSSYFFIDTGFIGTNQESLLQQDFYSGVGVGLRIRNESLIFDTFEIRLAYYPNTPNSIESFVGNVFGQSKADFPNFQGRKPEVLEFK